MLKIHNKIIGDKNPIFFVAEAGLNHNGELEIAEELIKKAQESGADAIKFQTYRTEAFLTESSEYFDFFKNVELKFSDFEKLKKYAEELGIIFFSAPFDLESVEFLKSINVPCFKVASSDLTNFPLLEKITETKTPMIISTGLATMNEVEEVIKFCKNHGNNNLALMHSVANYPTLPNEANLNCINTLKKKFGIPVGYSDNGDSTFVDIISASMGANIIEKHFTLSRKMEGPDHFFSIEPHSLKKLIEDIRLIEEIKGSGEKSPQHSELENMKAIRKSLTTSENITEGEKFSQKNIAIKRPAEGIEPKFYSELIGKKANKDILKDTPLTWDDIKS